MTPAGNTLPPLPQGFLDMLASAGSDIFKGLPAALDGEAPSVAVRINPAKAGGMDIVAPLADGSVPWEPAGRYLAERPAFTFDPLFHQGAYYVQDPSSMITGHIVRSIVAALPERRPLLYLDACAAPGGKTTAAIASLPEGSIVVANEFTPSRVAPLRENLARWGYPYAVVTAGAVDRFTRLRGRFDIIAVDAPCSGEGMMRKDADARSQWGMGLVEQCAALQRDILAAAWPALKPGGHLVYSTCTFNTSEDEANLAWLIETLGAEPVEIAADPAWGIDRAITGPYPAMRFIPGRIRGEGLFVAVVRKPGTAGEGASKKSRTPSRSKASARPAIDKARYLARPDDFDIVAAPGGELRLMPASPLLPAELREVCHPAVTLGTLKGRDLVPDTSLAWSAAMRPDAFPAVDVDGSTALAFLRHEALALPPDAPRGIILLRHAGLPLGFVKNLGNRANNLHRTAWRILTPASEPSSILRPSDG